MEPENAQDRFLPHPYRFTGYTLRNIWGWRKLRNEELKKSSSPDITAMKSRIMHMAGTGEIRSGYKILIRNPEAKRPLGRPRCRWENNIKIDFRETG
jgi:hypothetical protein